jgi:hypothetical protein
LEAEQWSQRFANELSSRIDDRNSRLNTINNAFEETHGVSYGEYAQQQRVGAWQSEKSLPTIAQDQLNAARDAAFDQLKQDIVRLTPEVGQIAQFEAPMRVALDPAYNPASTTFKELTVEEMRRRQIDQLAAEGRRLDDQNAWLLAAEMPFRGLVVAGGTAAQGLGQIVGGTPGAVAAGVAYSAITAAPDVILGNKSLGMAAAEVAGGEVAGFAAEKYVEWGGGPPGLAASAHIGLEAKEFVSQPEFPHLLRMFNGYLQELK